MNADVITEIITENFAAFGWLAPSSLETRTLKRYTFLVRPIYNNETFYPLLSFDKQICPSLLHQ